MKKKSIAFMLLSIAALGLAACGTNASDSVPSESTSTPDSVPSESTSTPDSTPTTPATEYISAAALRSIMGSFTADGTMTLNYTGGYLPTHYDIHLAMDENAMETLYYDEGKDEFTGIQQIFNYADIQCYFVVDADNVVKYAPYYDSYGNYMAYDYTLLSAYTASFRTTYFEKTFMGTYAVVNQNARNLIASTLAATYYFEGYGNVETMELTVENDEVTNVKFTTVKQTVQATVKVSVSYDLNLTKLGTTEIESDVKPYDTYPEAKALGDALDALEGNVTVNLTVTVEDSDEVYNEGTAYLFDDLFYLSLTTYGEETYTQAFGYVDYPEKDGMMQFIVDDEGNFEATSLYEGYSVAEDVSYFEPSFVAPEMFEYKDGKYVTRSYQDVGIVAPYIVVDFDGSIDYTGEIAITLDDEGNLDTISYDVYFYTDATRTDVEAHHYVLTITSNEEKVTDLKGLEDFKDILTIFSNLTSDMFGVWADEEETYTVEINYAIFKINDVNVTLENVTQTSLTGKIGDTTYVATFGEDDETGEPYIDLVIDGGEAIRLYYAVSIIDQIADIYGITRLANPEDLGFEIFSIDDTYFEYGQVALFYSGDFTETTIEEYADMLKAGSYIYDFTNIDASEVFTNGSGTVAEFLGVDVVLVSAKYDAIVGIGSYEYEGQTLLFVFILAIN
ncbi:MAG: hypothetical protein J1F31_03785 [Erysipelotrichales bacterium]|nr:hypothetical protein [Erysipelotrichales bacterium]